MFKSILIVVSLTIILISCIHLFDAPQTTVVKVLSNFERTKKAVLLQDDGNATVGQSLHVSVFNDGYTLTGKETGNVFTVDGNYSATKLNAASISFNWRSNDTLQIDFGQKLRTFMQEKKVNGVTIIYKVR